MMYLVDYIGLRNTNHVDKSYLIFNNHFDLPIHQEAEIIVPYEKSRELVTIVRDLILEKRFPVNYITEVCLSIGLMCKMYTRLSDFHVAQGSTCTMHTIIIWLQIMAKCREN